MKLPISLNVICLEKLKICKNSKINNVYDGFSHLSRTDRKIYLIIAFMNDIKR